MVLVDLTMAFDTTGIPLVWEVLGKYRCPCKLLDVIKALHDDTVVRVLGNGVKSDHFNVCSAEAGLHNWARHLQPIDTMRRSAGEAIQRLLQCQLWHTAQTTRNTGLI